MTKRCNICGKEKPLKDFWTDKRLRDGLKSQCKSCTKTGRSKIGQKEWRAKNLKRKMTNHRMLKYGITEEDYNKMFAEQKGCCAICGKHQSEFKRTLNVDHNHITGNVRGLLCRTCNMALGGLGADAGTSLLKKAINYVNERK